MRQAIIQLKYQNIRSLAARLAGLLQEYITVNPAPADVLVPVPLHPKRLRERGYNHSGLIARELGKLTGIPVSDDCLIRRQHNPPQARTTSIDQRRNNVAGAFTCLNSGLRDRCVLLIDDVATSGATFNACAEVLKASGAKSVWGLAMAREI
jgi:ComF family protein